MRTRQLPFSQSVLQVADTRAIDRFMYPRSIDSFSYLIEPDEITDAQ